MIGKLKTKRLWSAGALACVLFFASGCAVKNPRNFRWIGCRVVNTWTDQDGTERKDCQCLNAKQIGTDAKTGAAILQCH